VSIFVPARPAPLTRAANYAFWRYAFPRPANTLPRPLRARAISLRHAMTCALSGALRLTMRLRHSRDSSFVTFAQRASHTQTLPFKPVKQRQGVDMRHVCDVRHSVMSASHGAIDAPMAGWV
jgi:hypothetical protein